MYKFRPDMICGLKQATLFQHRNHAHTNAAHFLKSVAAAEKMQVVTPEEDALRFYFGNHIFSLIASKFGPHAILPDKYFDLAHGYVSMAHVIGYRLLSYTAIVIAREARHLHNVEGIQGHLNSYESLNNEVCKEFVKNLRDHGEEGAKKQMYKCTGLTIEQIVWTIERIFKHGHFNSGYGGEPWREIAQTLLRYIRGETTLEMFIDTAFTLAHNNGPMFNKGMIYSEYANKYNFIAMLDAQSQGKIPNYIHDGLGNQFISTDFSQYIASAFELFPELKQPISVAVAAKKKKAAGPVLPPGTTLYQFGTKDSDVVQVKAKLERA